MFKIDNDEYNMPCSIVRKAEIRSSELSGILMDKTYFNDPLATYLTYTISIVIPIGQEANYSNLYETLVDPVVEHTVVLPYNQTMITIKGRIQAVSDEYFRESNASGVLRKMWRKTKFDIISNYPLKVS